MAQDKDRLVKRIQLTGKLKPLTKADFEPGMEMMLDPRYLRQSSALIWSRRLVLNWLHWSPRWAFHCSTWSIASGRQVPLVSIAEYFMMGIRCPYLNGLAQYEPS